MKLKNSISKRNPSKFILKHSYFFIALCSAITCLASGAHAQALNQTWDRVFDSFRSNDESKNALLIYDSDNNTYQLALENNQWKTINPDNGLVTLDIDYSFNIKSDGSFVDYKDQNSFIINAKKNVDISNFRIYNKLTLNGGNNKNTWVFRGTNDDGALHSGDDVILNAKNNDIIIEGGNYCTLLSEGDLSNDKNLIDIKTNSITISSETKVLERDQYAYYNSSILVLLHSELKIEAFDERVNKPAIVIQNKGTDSRAIKVFYGGGNAHIKGSTVLIDAPIALHASGFYVGGALPFTESAIKIDSNNALIKGKILSVGMSSIDLADASSTYHIKGDLEAGRHDIVEPYDTELNLYKNFYAILPGAGTINLAGQNSTLDGNVSANYGGTVNITLNNGRWVGNGNNESNSKIAYVWYDENWTRHLISEENPYDKKGFINLTLNGSNATWDVTGNSQINTLTSNEGILETKVDLASADTGTNQVTVTETVDGKFNAILHVSNGDKLTIDDQRSLNWFLSQENGTLTRGEVKSQPGSAGKYDVAFFADSADASAKGSEKGTGKGKWYVVAVKQEEGNNPNPDKPPVSDEVDQVLSLGTSLTQAVGMLSETEDLRMRMGDVRHGDTDGLWVRTYSRKDTARGSFGNGFEQDVHGFHIGADHVIRTNNNASWLLGGAFHYGQSDIEGAAEAGGGDADIDQYTFKAYATYMKDNGTFADIVLHTGYYDTTLKGLDNTESGRYKADYSNWGYGLSAEVGHRIDLSRNANSWYVEPTAQLTWFHAEGKNFKTSTGLEINQGDADFITGRLGAAVGKVFALGTANDPMSSYFSVAMKGGMLYQFDGDQTITAHGTDGATVVCADAMDMKGARAYYGLTADWKIDDTWRVYGQISREEGSGYTKDYDASIGVRYAF